MSLWKHQARGVEFALDRFDSHGGCLLAWEMGTGKTRTALEIAKRRGAERMLVVAPKAVLPVWETEAGKYFSDAPQVLVLNQGTTKTKAKELALFGSGIVTVNYESVWREPLATALKHWQPQLLVLDEVHRIKANRGKASRWIGAFATSIEARLGLSGTPLAHSPLDIYGLYRALAPDIFPSSYTRFRERYTRPALMSEWYDDDLIVTAGRGGELQRWKLKGMDDLEEKMYLIADRVKVDDVLDLPESTDETIEVQLEPKAKRVYSQIKQDFITNLGGSTVTAANAMVVALRLSQITGGTLKDEDAELHEVSTATRDALQDYLKDCGEPVVVFGRFHSDLDAIHAAAESAGLSSSELSGRVNELERWQQGETSVLVAQVQSGSVGIDLTRARIAIWYSLSYSLSEYLQARARVLRPGQRWRNVLFKHVVARNSVDEGVYRALESRGKVVDAIVDGLLSGA